MAEYTASPNTNLNDPAVIEEMKKRVAEAERLAGGKIEVSQSDLTDDSILAGYNIRPLSAGVMAVLERSGNSLITGAQVDAMKMDDIMTFLYVLLADVTEDVLIDEAFNGTLARAALKWSFSVEAAEMKRIMTALPRFISDFSETIGPFAGDEPNEKKTRIG